MLSFYLFSLLAKFSRPAHFQSGFLAGIIDHVGQPFAIQAFKFPME
jgi:hypothetical protein